MKTQLLLVVGLLYASSIMAQPEASFRLDTVQGCPGEIVELPVRLYGVKDLGITSFMFYLDIDTAVLEPVTTNGNFASERPMGQPVITELNPKLVGRFVANYGWNLGYQFLKPVMILTYISSSGQTIYGLEDGTLLGKIHLRIKQIATEPIVIKSYFGASNGIYYDLELYKTSLQPGVILPKPAPKVVIEGKSKLPGFFGLDFVDFYMCELQSLPLQATGAQRYVWDLNTTGGTRMNSQEGSYYGIPESGEQNETYRQWVTDSAFDRTDVDNPIFTHFQDGRYKEYRTAKIVAKGYNADGCYGSDTALVFVSFVNTRYYKLLEQLDYHFVRKDSVMDLKLLWDRTLSTNPIDDPYFVKSLGEVPFSYQWLPTDKVERPNDSVTKTLPLTEPTWFTGIVRGKFGCETRVDVKVDIHGDSLFGYIGKNVDYFCGEIGGLAEDEGYPVSLAALVKGGSDEKIYDWEFSKLHNKTDHHVVSQSENGINIKITGTTVASVRITDLATGRILILTDTIFVHPIQPSSITIELDAKSQIQYEKGYCVGMPITFIASTENLGVNPDIFWEINGYRTDLKGSRVTFSEIGHQRTVRAVAYSKAICPDQMHAYSEAFDPKSEWYQITGVYIRDISHNNSGNNVSCNTDSAILEIYPHNLGVNPFFEVFRNDILVDTFTFYGSLNGEMDSLGNQGSIIHKVKSFNYHDRFSVRFTNTSCNCLIDNNHTSNYVYPNLNTTNAWKMPVIVTDVGSDTICEAAGRTYAVSLQGMEQFEKNTTVIWMHNDKEWMRYEYDAAVSAQFPNPPEKHENAFVVSANEQSVFDKAYPFYLNDAEGKYPEVYNTFQAGDKLWAIVVSSAECGGTTEYHYDTVKPIYPKFIPLQPATADPIASLSNVEVCKGDEIIFTVQNVRGAGNVTPKWFWNGIELNTKEMSCEITNPKNGDSVMVVLTSDYKCADNLPLQLPVVFITVHELPVLEPEDVIACNGDEVKLKPNAPTAVAWQWTSTATMDNPTLEMPTVTGLADNSENTHSLTITDANGCQTTADFKVIMLPKNPVTAEINLTRPEDTLICKGTPDVTLNADYEPNLSDLVWLRNGYVISGQNNKRSITPANLRDGDQIQLQITASKDYKTCYPKTAVSPAITFHVNPPVLAKIQAESLTLCDQESIQLTVLGSKDYDYTWKTSDVEVNNSTETTVFVKPETTTKYVIEIADKDAVCTAKDSVEIRVLPYLPVSNTIALQNGGQAEYCANADSLFTFQATTVNPGESPVYEWYVNGELRPDESADVFTARLTDGDKVYSIVRTPNLESCGELFAQSNEITVVRLQVPDAAVFGDTNVCVNQPVSLLATGGVEYLWTNTNALKVSESASYMVTPGETETFYVRVEGENNCAVSLSVTVEVTPTPAAIQAEIRTEQDSLCNGAQTTIELQSNYTEKRSILWYVNEELQASTEAQFTAVLNNNDAVYARVVVDDEKCLEQTSVQTNRLALTYFAAPVVVLAKNYDTVCQGQTLTATASSDNATILWASAEAEVIAEGTSAELQPNATTFYTLSAIIGNCESAQSETLHIHVNALPADPQMSSQMACKEPVLLTVENPQAGVRYMWSKAENNGGTVEMIPVGEGTSLLAEPATYIVSALNPEGCYNANISDVFVEQGDIPVAMLRVLTDEILVKEPVVFENMSTDSDRAIWDFGDDTPEQEDNADEVEHTYQTIRDYPLVLKVESPDGCWDTAFYTITVLPQLTGVFVPSGFMPSATNEADRTLRAFGENVASVNFQVYTMEGVRVFESDNIEKGWNGIYNGKEMPTGNYTYIVVVKMADGREIKKSGISVLIR